MKKLTEWIIGLNTVCIIWLSLLLHQLDNNKPTELYYKIQMLPVVVLTIFCVVSLAIILYRVATFNDCQSAAVELRAEIEEAKEALLQKGFKFN